MRENRGNPAGGAVIRAGATVELSEYWAKKFIEEGSAELVKEEKAAEPKEKKNGKSKS